MKLIVLASDVCIFMMNSGCIDAQRRSPQDPCVCSESGYRNKSKVALNPRKSKKFNINLEGHV